jgi:hypothetical protein
VTILFFILAILSIPYAVKAPDARNELKIYSPLEHPVQSLTPLDFIDKTLLYCTNFIYLLSFVYLVCMFRFGIEGNLDKMTYMANCMLVTFIVATLIKYVSKSERL